MNVILQTRKILALSLVLVGLAADVSAQPCQCDNEARVPGVLVFNAERTPDAIAAPPTVRAGEVFQLTVTTYGGGCDRAGDTGVVYNVDLPPQGEPIVLEHRLTVT